MCGGTWGCASVLHIYIVRGTVLHRQLEPVTALQQVIVLSFRSSSCSDRGVGVPLYRRTNGRSHPCPSPAWLRGKL